MNISKLFQLTEEDKAQYQKLIDRVDLNSSGKVIRTLNTKLDKLIASDILNEIEC